MGLQAHNNFSYMCAEHTYNRILYPIRASGPNLSNVIICCANNYF